MILRKIIFLDSNYYNFLYCFDLRYNILMSIKKSMLNFGGCSSHKFFWGQYVFTYLKLIFWYLQNVNVLIIVNVRDKIYSTIRIAVIFVIKIHCVRDQSFATCYKYYNQIITVICDMHVVTKGWGEKKKNTNLIRFSSKLCCVMRL